MRSRTTQERGNTFPYTLPDPDLEIRGPRSPNKIFSALRLSVWSKNKGGLAPRPLPWIRQCYTNSNTVFPRIIAGGRFFLFCTKQGQLFEGDDYFKYCSPEVVRVVIFRA